MTAEHGPNRTRWPENLLWHCGVYREERLSGKVELSHLNSAARSHLPPNDWHATQMRPSGHFTTQFPIRLVWPQEMDWSMSHLYFLCSQKCLGSEIRQKWVGKLWTCAHRFHSFAGPVITSSVGWKWENRKKNKCNIRPFIEVRWPQITTCILSKY